MNHIFDLIIIGAGASGLLSAIVAADNGNKVLIIEKNDNPGKKLLATGNGKCNFTNTHWTSDSFRGDSEFAYDVYKEFDYKKTIEYFEKIGIQCLDKNGYCYPYSRQAKAVCDCLLHKLYKLGVKIVTGTNVVGISKKQEIFQVVTTSNDMGEEFYSNNVLIATGGKSYKSLGSDGSGYKLAKNFGHHITGLYPALVKLYVTENIKMLEGVRVLADVKLSISGKEYRSFGEIIFGKDSISGIPVFEISRYAAIALAEKKEVVISIDLVTDKDVNELEHIIDIRKENISNKTYRLLIGLVNEKIATYLSNNKENEDTKVLANNLKGLRFSVSKPGEFDIAQVTAGGVDTKEISRETMESKLVKGIYFAGEIVNVDGNCGGYNLQWAWSSGYVVGNSIKGKGNYDKN